LLYPLSYQGSCAGSDSASDPLLPLSFSTWRRPTQRRLEPPPVPEEPVPVLGDDSTGICSRPTTSADSGVVHSIACGRMVRLAELFGRLC
jgi:hypothetical protein